MVSPSASTLARVLAERPPKRVAFVLQPKIGDTVNLTPVAGWMKSAWPGVRVVGVTKGPALDVARACPWFDEVWNRGSGVLGLAGLTYRLRGYRPELVVASYAHNGTLRAVRLAGVGPVVGVANSLDDRRFHACALYERGSIETPGTLARLFSALGVDTDDWRPRLEVRHGPRQPGQVAVNVGASHPAKQWPLDRFVEVSERLLGRGIKVVWVGPQGSGSPAPAGAEQSNTGILESAAVLAESAVLLTNDSGPMHLAAAMGTPVVGLFGPTRIEHYRPWGEGHFLIQGECPWACGVDLDACRRDCFRAISVDAVEEAVLQLLA